MSHSSKLVSARRDELDTTHEQLSLFAPKKTGEQRETTSIENGTEKKQNSKIAQAPHNPQPPQGPAESHRTAARTKKSAAYSAADIQVLEGIAAIRHRPGMYKTAGGLHGVGATIINALSEKLTLTIWKDGRQFTQVFNRGAALPHQVTTCDPKLHGTQLHWLYDRSIFDAEAYYSLEAIESRLKAGAYLNGGVTFHLDAWDDATNEQIRRVFYSREGLPDYVRDLATGTSAPLFKHVIGIAKEKDSVQVEVALQPTTGYKTTMYSFANAVRTRDGGVHETGFKAALTKVVHDYALKWKIIKSREEDGFRPEVIQQGLNTVISVKLTNPQF